MKRGSLLIRDENGTKAPDSPEERERFKHETCLICDLAHSPKGSHRAVVLVGLQRRRTHRGAVLALSKASNHVRLAVTSRAIAIVTTSFVRVHAVQASHRVATRLFDGGTDASRMSRTVLVGQTTRSHAESDCAAKHPRGDTNLLGIPCGTIRILGALV